MNYSVSLILKNEDKIKVSKIIYNNSTTEAGHSPITYAWSSIKSIFIDLNFLCSMAHLDKVQASVI